MAEDTIKIKNCRRIKVTEVIGSKSYHKLVMKTVSYILVLVLIIAIWLWADLFFWTGLFLLYSRNM